MSEDVLNAVAAHPRFAPTHHAVGIGRQQATRWTTIVESDLPAVESAWRDLEQRAAGTMFQTYDWCKAWADASVEAGTPETIRVLVLVDGSRVGLVWPFAIRNVLGQRVLHSLGEPATQYSQVLISPDDDDEDSMIAVAWKAIRSWTDVDVVELRRVRDESPLARCKVLAPYRVPSSREGAPFVDFTKLSETGAVGQRSSRSRNALRRHEKRLAAEGEVRFRLVEARDTAAQLDACREAFRLKAIWSAEKAAASTGYSHPASERAMTKLAERGHFCGAVLEVGGQTAAVELGVHAFGVYYSLIQSYDLRLALHAPGRLLFWHLLEHCPKIGIDTFDFLAPRAAHKLEWSNRTMPIADYILPLNVRGQLVAWYLSRMKPFLRNLYHRLPPTGRTLVARLQKWFA